MSNPFAPQFQSAPSAAPSAAAPVQHTAPPAPVVQGPSGLDDPSLYSGFNTPLLPNTIDGRWGLKILSVVGAKGYESGQAVHISFEVLTSTNPAIKPGENYRIFYRFAYQTMQPVEGKQGTVHAGLLGKFVAALFRREYTDPTFSKTEALKQICTNALGGPGHDFGTAPGYVELMGELRDRTTTNAQTKVESKSRLRSDMWLPFTPTT